MVPSALAAKLEGLMREVDSKSEETRPILTSARTGPQARKNLHAQVIRCYALLQEIRSLPGLDHFMLGESHDALCSVASTHPVVVLAGSRGYFYALVLKPDAQQHEILELQLSNDDIYVLIEETAGIPSRPHRGAPMSEDPKDEDVDPVSDRTMKLSEPQAKGASSDSFRRRLKLLWTTTVKPILDHLGLRVSCPELSMIFRHTYTDLSHQETSRVLACTGVSLAYSTCNHSTQPEFTTEIQVFERVAQTMLCHRIHPRSLPFSELKRVLHL
jgi:hypothetical protein